MGGNGKRSQSPQIGSMFLTSEKHFINLCCKKIRGRNPLKSGQCFLREIEELKKRNRTHKGRNPLKSGQCFLLRRVMANKAFRKVAIPSNRVNVSYFTRLSETMIASVCRNPLKSGQCFLRKNKM